VGTLIFRCPRTANFISAQVETDEASIKSSRDLAMRVYCLHCKEHHELPVAQAIVEDLPPPASDLGPGTTAAA
jgi:hypothetical protein